MRQLVISSELLGELKAGYASGLSVWKLAKIFNLTGQQIHRILKRAGTSFRSKEESIRHNKIAWWKFDDLSNEACYWLGLIYADGCVRLDGGQHRLSLTTHTKDIESIEGLCTFLELPNTIKFRKDKKAAYVNINSKRLIESLLKLGVVPNKTFKIRIPKYLPKKGIPHFIRGYFDGDGCAYTRLPSRYKTRQLTISFAGNPKFISDLIYVIDNLVDIKGHYSLNKNSARADFYGHKKLAKLYTWMYPKTHVRCLARKQAVCYTTLKAAGYLND